MTITMCLSKITLRNERKKANDAFDDEKTVSYSVEDVAKGNGAEGRPHAKLAFHSTLTSYPLPH